MNHARWRAAALFFAISALAAAPAFAMPGSKTVRTADPAERFATMDTSKDGNISWEEFQTARPNLNENAFKMIDKDADGGISLEEWKAFSTGHGGAVKSPDMGSMMKAMGGKGGMPAMPGMNAIPCEDGCTEHPAPSSGMPLIMPPAQAKPEGSKSSSMPLIMPPKASE